MVIFREWRLENIIYAISISLQIVGAVILLIGQLTKKGIEENSPPQIPSLMVAKDQIEVKSKCENYRWMMALIIVLLTILLVVVLEVYAKYEGARLSEKMNINDPIPDGTISLIEVQNEK